MMRLVLAMLLAMLCIMRPAVAHPSPSTEVLLELRQDQVQATIQLPLEQLQLAFPQPLSTTGGPLPAGQAGAIRAYLVGHIRPTAPDGRAWVVQVQDLAVNTSGAADLQATVALRPPKGAPVRCFNLEYTVISHQVPNHTVLVSLRKGWYDGQVRSDAVPQLLATLHWGERTLAVRQDEGGWWRGFFSLFQLGMEHIREGSDHLLFLFTLLMPAPLLAAGRKWGGDASMRVTFRRLVGIVTAFTVGHSLTLAAGACGLVHLPAQPVEVLIAVSILVSAVHAWRPLFPGREAWVVAFFGLIHGLAFASTIAELRLSGTQLAGAILAFNLGIEAMQIGIVLAVTPCLLLAASTRFYPLLRRAGAVFAGIAASAWIVERISGIGNPLNVVINWTSSNGWWLLILVTLGALWLRMAGGERISA